MRLPRKKAEIDYTLSVQKIEEALVHHACLFIRGAPGSGKSTLLEQVTKLLQEKSKKTISLRVPRRMDKNVAIHWLAESLQVASKGDEIHLLSLVQEKIESEATCLCIDDFDKIQNFESLASFFIKSLEEGSLIASSQAYPEVDILIEADAYFYDHAGLSKEQTAELVDRLGLNFESKELFEEFYSYTNGNAFLIRTALSFWRRESFEIKAPLIWNGAEQYLYEKAIVAAEEQLYLDKLKKASLLKYDFARTSAILRKGSPAFIRSLKELRLIEEDQNSLAIKQNFRSFVRDRVSQSERTNIVDEILDEISTEKNSIESNVEQVFLYLEANNKQKAAELFSKHADSFIDRGLYREVEKMSEPIADLLEPNAFYCRTNVIGCLGDSIRAEKEILNYLENYHGSKSCIRLHYSAAYNANVNGDRKRAIQILKELISHDDPDQFFYLRALIQLAVYEMPIDPESATKHLSKAEEIQAEKKDLSSSDRARSYLLWAKSWLEWSAHNHKLAITLAEEACQIERNLNRNYEVMFYQMMCIQIAQEQGSWNYILEIYSKLKPMADLHAGIQIKRPVNLAMAELNRLKGNLKLAERSFQSFLSEPSTGKISRTDILNRNLSINASLTNLNLTYIDQTTRFLLEDNIPDYSWPELGLMRTFSLFLDKENKNLKYDFFPELLQSCEKLPPMRSLELCTWISEYFFQTRQCPKWFLEVDKIVSKLDQQKLIPHHLIQWKVNFCFSLLTHGYYAKAEDVANSIEKLDGTLSQCTLLHFRLCLWQAQLALRSENLNECTRQLQFAENLLSGMDSLREEAFFYALNAGLYLRKDQLEKSKSLLEGQKQTTDIIAIRHALGFTNTKDKPSRDSILFWTHFFKQSKLKRFEMFQVISSKGVKQIYQKDLKSNHSKRSQVIINEVKNSCQINSFKVDLSKRQTLWKFFVLFLENFSKPLEKEEICNAIWKENYNPLIHDSRIYTNIANLRKILTECGLSEVVLEKEGSYFFDPKLKFQWIKPQSTEPRLNERQKLILDYLDKNPTLKRETAQKITHSSAATIKRDLRDLCDRGHIQISGVGRASSYQIAPNRTDSLDSNAYSF